MSRSSAFIRDILAAAGTHLSAIELWELCRSKGVSVSLATTYNALRALVASGGVREIKMVGGCSVYDARLDQHAHLLCTSCGKLSDIDVKRGVSAIEREARGISGYSRLTSDITFRGVCPDCERPEVFCKGEPL